MALTGTLSTLLAQTSDTKIRKAIDFLLLADLSKEFETVSPGNNRTIEIDGRDIYAILQTYTSKTTEIIKIEGHRKYIDVQYIFEGTEKILLASATDISTPDEYNSEKDVYFPSVSGYSSIDFRTGEAVILTPLDLHGPCYCTHKPALVKKVVIKVAAS